MRRIAVQGTALALLLASCHLPDRWHATTGIGDGTLEAAKVPGERDFDSQYVEVGVSGALGVRPEPRIERVLYEPIQPQALPASAPIESGSIPWMELILLLAGAGTWKASEVGYRKVKSRNKPT